LTTCTVLAVLFTLVALSRTLHHFGFRRHHHHHGGFGWGRHHHHGHHHHGHHHDTWDW
jgi:hypothetical protein